MNECRHIRQGQTRPTTTNKRVITRLQTHSPALVPSRFSAKMGVARISECINDDSPSVDPPDAVGILGDGQTSFKYNGHYVVW